MSRPNQHTFEKQSFTMTPTMTATLTAMAQAPKGESLTPESLGARKVIGALVERGLVRETKAGKRKYVATAFGVRFVGSLAA